MSQPIQFTALIPPRIEDVKIYFSQKGLPACEAETFFLYFEKKQWKNRNGKYLREWKKTAYKWIAAIISNQPFLFDKAIH